MRNSILSVQIMWAALFKHLLSPFGSWFIKSHNANQVATPGFFRKKGGPVPKGSHKPCGGGRGGAAPGMVAKFHVLIRFKVLETESIFKSINIFLDRKIHFF